MDKSALRKKALRMECTLVRVLTSDARGQRSLALTLDDADRIREASAVGPSVASDPEGWGYFYAIQVVPDLDPARVKFGFARDVGARLRQHQTAAPTASVLCVWTCRERWELTAIDALSVGCSLLRSEVFVVPDLMEMQERGNSFFELLPPAF